MSNSEDQPTQRIVLTDAATGSSIQRLSPEILAEIFVHCLDQKNISNDIRRCPLLLCRVCSSWQHLALHTPKLWSTLNIKLRRMPISIKEFAEHLHTWIKRSGNLPLTLTLYYLGHLFRRGVDVLVKTILSVYGQFAARWEKVKINIDNLDFSTDMVLNSFPNPLYAPLLQSFSFKGKDQETSIVPAFSFPVLTKLVWSPKTTTLVKSNISWSILTHVDICVGYSFSVGLDIIRLCPNMTDYAVHFTEHEIGEPVELEDGPPITNQSIRYFHLVFSSLCKSLFSRLVLPSLNHLSLVNEDQYDSDEPHPHEEEISGLFTRSGCKLQKLCLHNPGFVPSVLIKHKSCQTLQELSCHSHYDPVLDDDTMVGLTRTPGKSDDLLCPLLEVFQLNSPVPMTPGLLGSMILSRCSGDAGGRLKDVTICIAKRDWNSEDQVLLEQVDDGVCRLKIELRYLIFESEEDEDEEIEGDSQGEGEDVNQDEEEDNDEDDGDYVEDEDELDSGDENEDGEVEGYTSS